MSYIQGFGSVDVTRDTEAELSTHVPSLRHLFASPDITSSGASGDIRRTGQRRGKDEKDEDQSRSFLL